MCKIKGLQGKSVIRIFTCKRSLFSTHDMDRYCPSIFLCKRDGRRGCVTFVVITVQGATTRFDSTDLQHDDDDDDIVTL